MRGAWETIAPMTDSLSLLSFYEAEQVGCPALKDRANVTPLDSLPECPLQASTARCNEGGVAKNYAANGVADEMVSSAFEFCCQAGILGDLGKTAWLVSSLRNYWPAARAEAPELDACEASSPLYSVPHLQQLHSFLCSGGGEGARGAATDSADALVNTVQQLTEAVLWGEKHNTDFFDFFCEAGILSDLVHMLGDAGTPQKVKVQLLQTLSMLLQNSRRDTFLYYLLSNSHLSQMIEMQFDLSDEEICSYYITFLKSLALRLNTDTVRLFFTQRPQPSFPLYVEAVKLFGHDDPMVQTAVLTISLQVFRIEDPQVRAFVLKHAAEEYFPKLASHLRDLWLRVNAAAAEQSRSQAEYANELQNDLLLYMADVFDLNIPELSQALERSILEHAVSPVLIATLQASLGPISDDGIVSPAVALFLARQVIDTLDSKALSTPLASVMDLRQDSTFTASLCPEAMSPSPIRCH